MLAGLRLFLPARRFLLQPAAMTAPKTAASLLGACLLLAVGACRSSESPKDTGSAPSGVATIGTAAPAASASAPSASALAPAAIPRERVEAALNPKGAPAYAGPVGTVEGVVRIEGPEAPKVDVSIPVGCGDAMAAYTKLFREGMGRTLGDALVTVTEYEGYVPPKREAMVVPIRGCAYDKRTVAMTFGERLEIPNRDTRISYLPQLLGSRHPVDLVAVPKGDAVKLYPSEVGRYVLGDGMARHWMKADVFVLKYSTHDVTGLDGKFRIENVPVGKARVTAYLPVLDVSVDREIEVKEGEPVTLELTLKYEPKKDGGK